MQLPILKRIVALLKERRKKLLESGNKGRGILKGIIEEHITNFPWLARNMVSHYIITYTEDKLVPLVIVTSTSNQTVVSGLTEASPVDMATSHITAITTPT
jgi:hypothetical protein